MQILWDSVHILTHTLNNLYWPLWTVTIKAPTKQQFPLKNEAPPIWKTNPPLKREAPCHGMIPGKSAINNNLKSSQNPWKICVKKFIYIKFGGLQVYSRQLYYQMDSFTDMFQEHFKPAPHPHPTPPCSPPSIDLSPRHVLNTCGKPWLPQYFKGHEFIWRNTANCKSNKMNC